MPYIVDMSDYLDNWIVQVRKGVVELFILNALLEREHYAYDLVKKLVTRNALGLKEGTVYPLLSRLKTQGLVKTELRESPNGPARKYYQLTELGVERIHAMNRFFDHLVAERNQLRGQ